MTLARRDLMHVRPDEGNRLRHEKAVRRDWIRRERNAHRDMTEDRP